MIEYSILLEAVDPHNNVWRSYCLEAGRDLFDEWFVEVTYGRKGAIGKRDKIAVQNRKQAAHYINGCLKRRRGSVQRIGVPYVVREIKGSWPEIQLDHVTSIVDQYPNDLIP